VAIVYKQRGGAFVGASFLPYWTATWPFATLEIHDDDTVIVKYFPFSRTLRISEIDIVEVDSSPFYRLLWLGGSAIKVHYQGKGAIRETYLSYDLKDTLERFRERGIAVRPAHGGQTLP
jgi:hypothetical protein